MNDADFSQINMGYFTTTSASDSAPEANEYKYKDLLIAMAIIAPLKQITDLINRENFT